MIKDVLSPITMMHIGIDNGNLFQAILFSQVIYHYCLVINITEPPVAMHNSHGVMSRGPDHGKTVPDLPCHQGISQGKSAPC